MSAALDRLKQETKTLQALMLRNNQGADAETMVLQEIEHLRAHAIQKPAILNCSPESVLLAVRQSINKNLTLDPSAGLVYIKTRSVNVSPAGSPAKYITVMETQDTCNGKISFARQCGRILDCDRPEVKKDESGKVISVSFSYQVPAFNEKQEKTARWVTVEFDESDFGRWRLASHKENGRNKADADNIKMNYANPNYTSFKGGIDPEFARAKSIIHGLKKLGTNQNEIQRVLSKAEYKTIELDPAAEHEALQEEFTPVEILAEGSTIPFSAVINTPTLDQL